MIKKPNNWESVQAFADKPKLPVGAYVCRIKQAKVQNTDWGDQLAVLFDIEEGEYAGFYQREFNANTEQDKKWKGVLRLWLPLDNGDVKDEYTKRTLKGFVTSVEKSNPGYAWAWDESTLAGKMVGVLFREEEWEKDDRTGWAVRPYQARTVETVRNGDYKIPDSKPLAASKPRIVLNVPAAGLTPVSDIEDELPF